MGGSSTKQAPPQTATQVTQLPAFVQPTAQRYLNRAEALSQAPFQSYQGTRISPLNSVHNFALDQARQQFMPQMTGAATQMGNFMGGAFNEPAYIHPYLGPMLPMQSYQGISRPYPVGPGGSPGGGGKGGQQPPPQYPVQPGFPSGPPDPITGTPIDPNQPTFPEIPSPTAPGPTAPVTGDGSVGLPSFTSGPDERDDVNDPDPADQPGPDDGLNFSFDGPVDQVTGPLGGMLDGISQADLITAALPLGVGSLAGNLLEGAGIGTKGVFGASQDSFEDTPAQLDFTDLGTAFTDPFGSFSGYPDFSRLQDAAPYDQLEAQTFPVPELAATMPAPEQIEDMNYGAPAGPVDSDTVAFHGSGDYPTYSGLGTAPGPPAAFGTLGDFAAAPEAFAPSLGYAPNSLTLSDFAAAPEETPTTTYQDQVVSDLMSQYDLTEQEALSIADIRGLLTGQPVAPTPAPVKAAPKPETLGPPTALDQVPTHMDLYSAFEDFDGGSVSFGDIGDYGFDSDIGLGY